MKKQNDYKKIFISSVAFLSSAFCLFSSLKIINGIHRKKIKQIASSALNKINNKKVNLKNPNLKLSNNNIKKDDLKEKMIKNIKNQKNKINSKDPLSYDFSEWNIKAGKLMVINKNNKVSNNLVKKISENLHWYDKRVSVWREIYDDLCAMFKEAKKDGLEMWVCSGFRHPDYQKKLFDRKVKEEERNGFKGPDAEKQAEKTVAKPWHSEHNTGLAVDINCADSSFGKSKQYQWMKKNAHRFGFIERYLSGKESITGCIYEPWHWRYVGKEEAEKIKNSGLSLEEYIIFNKL